MGLGFRNILTNYNQKKGSGRYRVTFDKNKCKTLCLGAIRERGQISSGTIGKVVILQIWGLWWITCWISSVVLLQNGKLGFINRVTACKTHKIFLLLCVVNVFSRIQYQKVDQLENKNRNHQKSKNLYFYREKRRGLNNLEKRLWCLTLKK